MTTTHANLRQPFLFAVLYLSYKYIYPRSSRVDLRNLTLEVYVLEDLSTIELESPLPTQPTLRYAMESHELAVQMGGIVSPTSTVENSHKEEQTCVNVELSTEVQEEIEAQDARREAKERISQILRGRPKRLERGVLRELWSFVVTDKE